MYDSKAKNNKPITKAGIGIPGKKMMDNLFKGNINMYTIKTAETAPEAPKE